MLLPAVYHSEKENGSFKSELPFFPRELQPMSKFGQKPRSQLFMR